MIEWVVVNPCGVVVDIGKEVYGQLREYRLQIESGHGSRWYWTVYQLKYRDVWHRTRITPEVLEWNRNEALVNCVGEAAAIVMSYRSEGRINDGYAKELLFDLVTVFHELPHLEKYGL